LRDRRRESEGTEGRDDPARSALPRLPHHADDAEIFENDYRTGERGTVDHRAARSGTEGRPGPLPLGYGSDRLPDRASIDQNFAAGLRRRAREIAAAFVFDRVESESASGPGPLHDRRGALHESRAETRRRLFHFSRGTRRKRADPGFPKHLEVSPPGRWEHADHHGRARNRSRAVPRLSAGTKGRRGERKELVVFWIAESGLQLFLPGRIRRDAKGRLPYPPRPGVVARSGQESLRPGSDDGKRG